MNSHRHLLENVLYLAFTIIWAFIDVGTVLTNPEDILAVKLRNASTYSEWKEIARQLDIILGNDRWRADPASTDYDHRLISIRLQHLRHARENKDVSTMVYRLRAGLLRNLGGLSNEKLFSRSLLGTKYLIEDYTEEVVQQLDYIAFKEFEGFSEQAKIEFFSDTRQSFGNTALMLHGGATFGLYHLGVVKCLFDHNILPRIITGSSVGALIASLVCVHVDEELPRIFQSSGINLDAFRRVGDKGSVKRKFFRLIKQGVLMDVSILEECVRSNVGDITFEEAFLKTKRILNIIVSSSRKNEVPRLMNYLTAPNMLIRSAACASCAVTGLYETVPLLIKNQDGDIVPWNNSQIRWKDPTTDKDGPSVRLAELFNVNHIIVSQANPYVLPFMTKKFLPQSPGIMQKVTSLVIMEIKHRLNQINDIGLLPVWMRGFVEQKISGHVNIFPDIQFSDYQIVFSNPSPMVVDHWILKGEQATWPKLALIKNRCVIELELDRILLRLRSKK